MIISYFFIIKVLSDLEKYGNALNVELVEIINKDYADFVNLSGNLVGMDKVVKELNEPINITEKEIKV